MNDKYVHGYLVRPRVLLFLFFAFLIRIRRVNVCFVLTKCVGMLCNFLLLFKHFLIFLTPKHMIRDALNAVFVPHIKRLLAEIMLTAVCLCYWLVAYMRQFIFSSQPMYVIGTVDKIMAKMFTWRYPITVNWTPSVKSVLLRQQKFRRINY